MTEEEKDTIKDAEKRLPKEMREALDLVTATLNRVKEFTKKGAADYIERLAYLIAGFGIAQAIHFWVQYQILWMTLYGGG